MGLALLGVVEVGLRVGGWGHPDDVPAAFAGRIPARPLFVHRTDTGRREIPAARLTHFCAESFAAVKPRDEYRIFVLGGSTVQGRPYATETAFTTWLELSLGAWDATRAWNVVNCGGVSYSTTRLLPILREVLDYEPDLLVLYTGHNEFLEKHALQKVNDAPAWVVASHRALAGCRLFNLMRSLWIGSGPGPSGMSDQALAAEVDALLDYRGGLADYVRDDAMRARVVEQYAHNLAQMVRLAERAGLPVLLVNPVSNLRNCPPFKSAPREDLTPAAAAEFAALMEKARAPSTSLAERHEALRAAVALDSRHADAQYRLGQALEALGRHRDARRAYRMAKEEDICPLRMLEPMHDALRRVARESSAVLVDVRRDFAARAPHGIPGKESLVDHVHPSIDGHKLVAARILEGLREIGVIGKPAAAFAARRAARYRRHARSLPPAYEMRGKQRLRGLQRWTEGRALGRR